ncbi:MAG: DJ-1/PfpI family protein [Phycisphaerae bacterium]|nr:DJ-1/PfpI family protein [Saprospiraceae bacterium]
MLLAGYLTAQSPEKPLSVGIFVYPGVEILDFTGPSEVFGSTPGFKPFIVAFKKEPVLSQGFITVTPQYSIDDCPPTDILLFPGGGTNSVMGEQKLIDWIKERAKTTQIMMSVCTGAGLLSKAGLLDGKEVTTFHGYLDELQKITPKATVLANTRFVDNGQVITTAGVSAGTDGALHVVAKIKGEATAKATAFYMEYDKWQPNAGKVNETAFIQDVRSLGLEAALKAHKPAAENHFPLYYPGELTDLAASLVESKPSESEAILRFLLKNYPPTPTLYDGLGIIMEKMGKAVPPDSRSVHQKLMAGDVDWAKRQYQKAIQLESGWMFFTEDEVNGLAYMFLNNKQNKEAQGLFVWITELFPNSPNAWDSLSEYYEMVGENAQAIAASETCLAKLSASNYDESRKKQYDKISKERIERLKQKR